MNLRIKDLKEFLSLSQPVTPNNIIPILQYAKLDRSSLSKTNMGTFITHKIDVHPEVSMLIDLNVLSAFMRECKGNDGLIEVETEGKIVWLKDGKRKMKYQSPSVADFPELPEGTKDNYTELSSDVLMSLGVAAKNTSETGISSVMDFVHLTKGYICATDNHRAYFKKIETLPEIVLTKETCNIVSQFPNAVYYRSGRYDFFEIGNTRYAFIQVDRTPPNFLPLIPKEQPEEFLEINAADFIGFCDTVTAASPSRIISGELNGSVLSYVDSEVDFEYNVELQTEGSYIPKFSFMPRLFGAFFKSLGADRVRLCDSGMGNGSLSVWDMDEKDVRAFVIGTMPSN